MGTFTITGYVKFTPECDHESDIPVGGLEGDHQCVTCGAAFRIPENRLGEIRAELHTLASDAAAEELRKQLDQAMRGVASRHKGVTYKPGR